MFAQKVAQFSLLAIAAAAIVGCGENGGGTAPDDDSPEVSITSIIGTWSGNGLTVSVDNNLHWVSGGTINGQATCNGVVGALHGPVNLSGTVTVTDRVRISAMQTVTQGGSQSTTRITGVWSSDLSELTGTAGISVSGFCSGGASRAFTMVKID
jgi:hypothetical protein